MNLEFIVKLQLSDTFETLFQMRLDLCWVLGFGQDLEKLFVRKEVETWEDGSLGLKVIVEAFLYFFKLRVCFLQD